MQYNLAFRLANIALRAATLGSKFLLVFFLAKFLTPEDLGLYGLISASIAYSLFFVGLDFYIFTTREIGVAPKHEWGKILKSQLALCAILYIIFIPLLTTLFTSKTIPWNLFWLFLCLLIVEHLSQELNRILVAISRPIEASIVLFFRFGLWGLVFTLVMYLSPEHRSLSDALSFWIAGSLSACGLGVVFLFRSGLSGFRKPIDWKWVISGVKISTPFLFATLALRGIYTADRYLMESMAGLDVLGAYVLFYGLANALMSFLDSGVFSFLYPGLIKAHTEKNDILFKKHMKSLTKQTTVLSLTFAILSSLTIPYILDWIGKPTYHEYSYLYPWIMLSIFIFCISMIPHYGLYAIKHDTPIIVSHTVGLAVFAASTYLLSDYSNTLAVPLGLCISQTAILAIKTHSYIQASNNLF